MISTDSFLSVGYEPFDQDEDTIVLPKFFGPIFISFTKNFVYIEGIDFKEIGWENRFKEKKRYKLRLKII